MSSLEDYSRLVREYHQTLDLISSRALNNWDSMLADAVQYGELIGELLPETGSILDVGSGVGLPGIPLAVANPDWTVRLVERRRRRSAFLNLVRGQLGLGNVTVEQADVATLESGTAQVITAQAVDRFAAVYALTRKLHAPEVLLVSSKGADWQAEAAELEECTGAVIAASAVRERHSGTGLIVGLRLRGGLECR